MKQEDEIERLNQLILEKEQEHKVEGLRLVEDFKETYESLRPINILKSTLKEAVNTPGIGTTLASAAVGMAIRYVAKKVTGSDKSNSFGNILQRLFGNKSAHAAESKVSISVSIPAPNLNGHTNTDNP